MTEHERDWHQEYKDDRAMGYDDEPEPPEEQPLDLDDVAQHYHEALAEDMTGIPAHCAEALAAVPGLLSRLRTAEEELADWRGREHRYEYSRTFGPAPSLTSPPWLVNREEAEQAWERPELGVPWVRTITTSGWDLHEPSPF
jgi:hypothetical protein